jgi:outer membrane protein OmpA-like peptidoglycan-associated protein
MRTSNALVAGLVAVGLVATGCESTGTALDTRAKRGALAGAVGGAIAGGLIGRNNGHGVGGAVIGAATGAVAGGLIGRYLDQQAQELDAIPGSTVQRRDDSLLLDFSEQLTFDRGSATLEPGAYDRLRQVARTLRNYPQSEVIVKGHADSAERSGQRLSEERADRVRALLISEGVESARITSVGYGASMPLASNERDVGRAQNRRVELEIRPDRTALEDEGR